MFFSPAFSQKSSIACLFVNSSWAKNELLPANSYLSAVIGIALSKYSVLTAPMIADIEQLWETKVLQIVWLLQNTGDGQNPLWY